MASPAVSARMPLTAFAVLQIPTAHAPRPTAGCGLGFRDFCLGPGRGVRGNDSKGSSTASAARLRNHALTHHAVQGSAPVAVCRHSRQGIGLAAADGRAPARVLISVTGLGRRTRRGLPVASEHRISGARNVRCSAAFCVRDRIGSDIVVFQQLV